MSTTRPNLKGHGMWGAYTKHRRRAEDGPEPRGFIQLLIKATNDPERHSVVLCHRHIVGMAQSIETREMSDLVLVLIKPDQPDQGLFGCFLCMKGKPNSDTMVETGAIGPHRG